MKQSETPPTGSTYTGHVKNGVIVVDSAASLAEGQAVRIEPIPKDHENAGRDAHANQLQAMKALFAQWDEEDSQVPDDVAEEFHRSLEQHRGLHFRTYKVE